MEYFLTKYYTQSKCTKNGRFLYALIAVLFVAGCGGGSQSNTAEMPVDPFVPIEPVEPTPVVAVAVARTPTFVKTLKLNTTYTGAGVVFANQDTGYWLDSPFWSTETRARIITHDARTGQAVESTNGITAFHGTEVVSAVIQQRNARGVLGDVAWGIAPNVTPLLIADDWKRTTAVVVTGSAFTARSDWDVANFSGAVTGDGYTTTIHKSIARITNYRNGKGAVIFAGAGNNFRRNAIGECRLTSYDPNRQTGCFGLTSIFERTPYAMAVGIISRDGLYKTTYSEELSSMFTVGTEGQNLATASDFISTISEGTSFSSPQLAGIAAQMLEANPALNWLDVREIIATSSRIIHSTFTAFTTTATNDGSTVTIRSGWITNAAGWTWSPWYGFGLIDGGRAVELAESWAGIDLNRYAETPFFRSANSTLTVIAGRATEVVYTIEITATVIVDSLHLQIAGERDSVSYRNGVQITLVSPSGTSIVLKTPQALMTYNVDEWQSHDPATDPYGAQEGVYHAVGFRGEIAQGTWQVRLSKIIDTNKSYGNDDVTTYGAQMRFFGLLP